MGQRGIRKWEWRCTQDEGGIRGGVVEACKRIGVGSEGRDVEGYVKGYGRDGEFENER